MYGLVYCATNLANNKKYIGQTMIPLKYRIAQHRCVANKNDNHMHFHNALKKYGIDGFKWEELFQAIDKESLDKAEMFFIDKYETRRLGYNKKTGGSYGKHSTESKMKMSKGHKGLPAWNKGIPRSQETKEKLRKANTGKPSPMKGKHHTEEAKKKISLVHKGKRLSEEHRKYISEMLRGIKHPPISEETRKKMSAAKMGHRSWNKGILHSEEIKRKIREARKRQIFTEETRNKMSMSHKGKPCTWRKGLTGIFSEETLVKFSIAQKKLWADPEHRRKMSEAQKRRWADPEHRQKMLQAQRKRRELEKLEKGIA